LAGKSKDKKIAGVEGGKAVQIQTAVNNKKH